MSTTPVIPQNLLVDSDPVKAPKDVAAPVVDLSSKPLQVDAKLPYIEMVKDQVKTLHPEMSDESVDKLVKTNVRVTPITNADSKSDDKSGNDDTPPPLPDNETIEGWVKSSKPNQAPLKLPEIFTGRKEFNISPSGQWQQTGPTIARTQMTPEEAIASIQQSPETAKYVSEHPEMVIPQHEIQAAEITKKVLAKNAENITKPNQDGKGFWDYVDLASKANSKPAIANPVVEQVKQMHEQAQQELEDYRKATELEQPKIIPTTNDESEVSNILGETVPKKYMPSLGHLPTLTPMIHSDNPLEGIQDIPYWQKKLNL